MLLSRAAARVVARLQLLLIEELSWPVQVGLQIKLKRSATEADVYSSLKLHKV